MDWKRMKLEIKADESHGAFQITLLLIYIVAALIKYSMHVKGAY